MRRSCLYDSIRSAASRRPGQLDVAALARCDRTCRPTPVALNAKIPNARPSMLLDATLKRRGEVDAISFTARRDDLTEVCVLVSGRVTLEVEGREPVTLGARRLLRDTSRMGRDRACPRDGAQGLSDRQRPGADSRSVTLGFARPEPALHPQRLGLYPGPSTSSDPAHKPPDGLRRGICSTAAQARR